jgi:thiol:disulfide interchange protein DsbA
MDANSSGRGRCPTGRRNLRGARESESGDNAAPVRDRHLKGIRLKRRQFSALAATATLGLGLSRGASAQGDAPINANDYTRVGTPIPVSTPPGTVDVVEFFSYACPHCFEFEPTLEAWLKHKAPEIRFRRSPVAFLQNFRNFQPLYFALESLGAVDELQQKIFNAVHLEHQRLDKPDDIAAFVAKNGVDPKKFMAAFTSFGTSVKVSQATQLFEASGANGVPTLMVGGRFLTSPTIVKATTIPQSEARAVAAVDYLVAQIRAGH